MSTLADTIECAVRYGPEAKTCGPGRFTGPASLRAGQIRADPERFQFRSAVDAEGVTEGATLDAASFDPAKAGMLLVWHDPAKGQAFVVDGHHRLELAKRAGYSGPLDVFLIDAESAPEARVFGHLANVLGLHP